ncbi:hypothetical protein CC78DRAFT_576509 [Lojkania enalia]|uniref:Uncharacterized protein n=1 Tax=Lojkania enalia TaxID=147567 RepID=A0A9P4KFU9_9PLEO|nr:hypothetical protein CC78DRAFT_576509 [Didymosphaeria enalia]
MDAFVHLGCIGIKPWPHEETITDQSVFVPGVVEKSVERYIDIVHILAGSNLSLEAIIGRLWPLHNSPAKAESTEVVYGTIDLDICAIEVGFTMISGQFLPGDKGLERRIKHTLIPPAWDHPGQVDNRDAQEYCGLCNLAWIWQSPQSVIKSWFADGRAPNALLGLNHFLNIWAAHIFSLTDPPECEHLGGPNG